MPFWKAAVDCMFSVYCSSAPVDVCAVMFAWDSVHGVEVVMISSVHEVDSPVPLPGAVGWPVTLAPVPGGPPPVVSVPLPGAVGWPVTLDPVPEGAPPVVSVPLPGAVGWPVTLANVFVPGVPPLVVPVPLPGAVG